MEASRDYFSMSVPQRRSAENVNWEHWHKSLALWDLQYALESPSIQETPTPGNHQHRQNFVVPRQSPGAMFSPSTYSDASLNTVNYMDAMSPIIANEEVMSMSGMEGYTSYSQLLERDSCVRPPLLHHGSSPAMLSGYPIPPSQTHQQLSGLGLGFPLRTDDHDDGSNSSNNPSPGRWEDSKPIINVNGSATPGSNSPHFAFAATSPGSKRSSVNITNGDDIPTPDSKTKRTSLKTRHRHSRSMTDNSAAGEPTSRTAKLAHNIVERNYRDRLNDQIAELSSYLFDFSTESKARSRPPKSLVISRAKERLMELTSHNEELLTQVTALKQQIAVLDHIVTASGGVDRSGLPQMAQRQSAS